MEIKIGDKFLVDGEVYTVDCAFPCGSETMFSLMPASGISEDGLMKTSDEIAECLEDGEWEKA